MKEKKLVKRAAIGRDDYVAPFAESYMFESCQLLAGTTPLDGSHDDGDDDGEITGAKEMNLNISFSDLWEE